MLYYGLIIDIQKENLNSIRMAHTVCACNIGFKNIDLGLEDCQAMKSPIAVIPAKAGIQFAKRHFA